LSLLATVFASSISLFVVCRQKMGLRAALVGSGIMGAGIATMHYTSIAAMRLSAMCHYSFFLVTLSVVVFWDRLLNVTTWICAVMEFHCWSVGLIGNASGQDFSQRNGT
jgi:NO-binding membrane sensor protein with MHYT domain